MLVGLFIYDNQVHSFQSLTQKTLRLRFNMMNSGS